MPISASRLVSQVKEEFEGGVALSVNWNTLIRRAAQKVLENVSPPTMKRTAPVYGGLARQVNTYYMPSEIIVPVGLFTNDELRKWDYQPPSHFFRDKRNTLNKFTVKNHNGQRLLYVRHEEGSASLSLATMETTTGVSGTVTPVLDSRNYLEGSGALRATFTDAGLYFGADLDDASTDITSYLEGVLLLSCYISDATKVAKIELRLETDASNYYSYDTDTDSAPLDSLVDYWNVVRFSGLNKTSTGSPDEENINSWKLYITATTGETVIVTVDNLVLATAPPLYIEGYDNRPFVTTAGVLWQSSLDYTTDSVNFDEDIFEMLHYELCLLVQGADKDMKSEWASQLSRCYQNWYDSNPSEEMPMSYNILPEMNRETDPTGRGYLDDGIWNSHDVDS